MQFYVLHLSRETTKPKLTQVSINGGIFAIAATETVKGKDSPYSITERRVPQLIPVHGSQPAGDVSDKPGGRLPLLSALRGLLPILLLGEQRHDGCEQFA